MKKRGKGFAPTVLAAVAVGAVGIGVVVALVAGYLLGHFTGHTNTTTVTLSSTETGSRESEAGQEPSETGEAAAGGGEAAAGGGEEAEGGGEGANQAPEGKSPKGGGGEAAAEEAALATGKEIVESTCSSCHTLSEAGASGTVGPNLDELKPPQALVETQVTNGSGGMPAFGGTLSSAEIEAVAEYVSKVAGTGNSSAG